MAMMQTTVSDMYRTREEMLALEGPGVVLTDNLRGFMGLLVRRHSAGNYSHACVLRSPNAVVSQDRTLRRTPLASYLDGRHRVKVWEFPCLDALDKARLEAQAWRDSTNGWRRRYDWLGVVGQWLKWRGLHFPWRWYCTEYVEHWLRAARNKRLNGLLDPHMKPAEMDVLFKGLPPETARVAGIYDPYDGA